ncbi:MAG: thermonuclease family protein [Opitutaceae bacterium]|nr:thermonuclease family protein [Opitutaceae bacterium]
MPTTALSTVPQSYTDLRKAVETTMVKGQLAADLARVRTYHETGRLIQDHVLLFKERADYGTQTLRRLATDINVDGSVLYRCVGFYRAFPIVATWPQLTWAHYRTLIPVADAKLRRSLATEANKEVWSVVQLEQRIRALLPPKTADAGTIQNGENLPALLKTKRGTPGICKVVGVGDGPVVDLGFACYLDLATSESFAAGDFVQLDRAGRMSAAPAATKADLFTYAVRVLKVVDGDTLWVKIQLWSRQWVKQKLRLRDLDCPEMNTAAGQAAKRFVDSLMAQTESVTICTTKPDKYDRYLADVFLETKEGETVFLNNALLANGHAVVKRAWEFSDWEEE